MNVTSYQNQSDTTQPYKVRTGCGHIVTRRMRPSTAGVPYSPDVILRAPNGAPCCDACALRADGRPVAVTPVTKPAIEPAATPAASQQVPR